jgi:hypothetical protein
LQGWWHPDQGGAGARFLVRDDVDTGGGQATGGLAERGA